MRRADHELGGNRASTNALCSEEYKAGSPWEYRPTTDSVTRPHDVCARRHPSPFEFAQAPRPPAARTCGNSGTETGSAQRQECGYRAAMLYRRTKQRVERTLDRA